jgi:putative transposase
MAGVRVVRTPACAPNCNAYAERFVRSIKEECLDRIVPLGERHAKSARQYVTHYHGERNHQGLGNELIDRPPAQRTRARSPAAAVGGILSHYYR